MRRASSEEGQGLQRTHKALGKDSSWVYTPVRPRERQAFLLHLSQGMALEKAVHAVKAGVLREPPATHPL